ncbi:hypothetical protein BDV38DRAFT_62371 [Aspergillus pseudotamarii]|uniref:Uncharacterized protein n=1 Tax=Aspergillus pseudotamarii TaxID=132259 RepID=A0A5N6TA48_ASPPS|nr:uncharacterized protein BDV38DRAFT_62371 [Aspergillus pseudotamarii]KAE8143166.1 hypothetical protein BDV38DRAFT_62371 [Aspergillus pseudotamarii]
MCMIVPPLSHLSRLSGKFVTSICFMIIVSFTNSDIGSSETKYRKSIECCNKANELNPRLRHGIRQKVLYNIVREKLPAAIVYIRVTRSAIGRASVIPKASRQSARSEHAANYMQTLRASTYISGFVQS